MPGPVSRHRLALAAAMLLLAAAPVRAQPASEQEIPAEVVAPDAEAQQFFEALEAGLIDGEALNGVAAEMVEQMDAAIAQIMVRGERLEDWRTVGVDLGQIAAARDGGRAGNMLDSPTEFGVLRTYFADHPLESILPPGLKLIWRTGPTVAGENVLIEVGHVSPRLIMVMRAEDRREGNALCSERTETSLYSDPRIPASQLDLGVFFFSQRFAERLDQLGLCSIAEEREPGRYHIRGVDRQGYRLPELAEATEEPARFVPLAPVPAATPRR